MSNITTHEHSIQVPVDTEDSFINVKSKVRL